ncbi:LPXTG cell wall anchor domain-containing protein [Levilactobacillus fuyuanensis]|uniref:SpaA isopeptide-forming pilin-related protein n=1 Tax=Levilactobacillus fuyuanensis TaxID=2486022 RepID=A0ABW4H3U2_9LACO|nr:LPXTG cell wall anchor domain-containing protein [Levilactobacillus fuyuanensis]
MRRKITTVVIGVLIVIAVFLVGGFATGGVTAQAGSVEVSGLGGGDAIITDANGKVVSNGTDLSKWDNYTLDYNWSIPDGEAIKDGDTVTVTFPPTAVGRRDVTFPLYDDHGQQIGTFSIKEGESTGTITFNGALANTTKDRKGTLQFYVKGSAESNNVDLDWGINKVGWVAERNPDGSPAKLTWNIAFNPTSSKMDKAVVTDSLGPGQTYIPGSVHAQTGSYDSNGFFTSDGGSITPEINVMGNTLTFTFSNVTTAVNMTYQTTPEVSGTGGTWKNNASLNGQSVGSRIVWGGSGTGNGGSDQQAGEVILKKTAKTNGEVLAGAVYELQDVNGEVIKSDLVTDAEGIIKVDGLAAGDYQFVETTPPAGFELNKTPIPFTIKDGQTAAVTVAAEDVRENSSSEGGGNPENPGGVTPPTNPGTTNPENPGTETPVNPENPEKPGTETPTNPENPQKPTKPVKPTKPQKPSKPVKPVKPVKPTTQKPGSSSTYQPGGSSQQPVNGGAGAYTTGGTSGQESAMNGQQAGNTNGVGTGSGTGRYVGHTLPQTGERSTQPLIWAGLVLLVASGFGLVTLKRKN